MAAKLNAGKPTAIKSASSSVARSTKLSINKVVDESAKIANPGGTKPSDSKPADGAGTDADSGANGDQNVGGELAKDDKSFMAQSYSQLSEAQKMAQIQRAIQDAANQNAMMAQAMKPQSGGSPKSGGSSGGGSPSKKPSSSGSSSPSKVSAPSSSSSKPSTSSSKPSSSQVAQSARTPSTADRISSDILNDYRGHEKHQLDERKPSNIAQSAKDEAKKDTRRAVSDVVDIDKVGNYSREVDSKFESMAMKVADRLGFDSGEKLDARQNLHDYAQALDLSKFKENDSKNDVLKRLTAHQVEPEMLQKHLSKAVDEIKEGRAAGKGKEFDPKMNDVITAAISESNEAKIKEQLKEEGIDEKSFFDHYKKLGFEKGEFSQMTAKQFIQSYKDYQGAKEARQEFKDNMAKATGPEERAALQKAEDARLDKQTVALMTQGSRSEFDHANEFASLRAKSELDDNGMQSIIPIQATRDEDLSAKRLGAIADEIGPFHKVVEALGHGREGNGAGNRMGDREDLVSGEKFEKIYFDDSDLKEKDSPIRAAFQDENIFAKNAQLVSLSCNFCGATGIDKHGDPVKKPVAAKDSMAAALGELRPDMDISGSHGRSKTDGLFSVDDEGKIDHTYATHTVKDGNLVDLDSAPDRSQEDTSDIARSEADNSNIDSNLSFDDELLGLGFDDDDDTFDDASEVLDFLDDLEAEEEPEEEEVDIDFEEDE